MRRPFASLGVLAVCVTAGGYAAAETVHECDVVAEKASAPNTMAAKARQRATLRSCLRRHEGELAQLAADYRSVATVVPALLAIGGIVVNQVGAAALWSWYRDRDTSSDTVAAMSRDFLILGCIAFPIGAAASVIGFKWWFRRLKARRVYRDKMDARRDSISKILDKLRFGISATAAEMRIGVTFEY